MIIFFIFKHTSKCYPLVALCHNPFRSRFDCLFSGTIFSTVVGTVQLKFAEFEMNVVCLFRHNSFFCFLAGCQSDAAPSQLFP